MIANWSSLPLDVLTIVVANLTTFEDFVYFSAVCHWWNQASSLIKNDGKFVSTAPWLLLVANTEKNPNCVRKIFSPSNKKCYQLNLRETFGKRCFGSSHGWLILVDRKLNVQLFNPITKAQIHFPSLNTLPSPPEYDKKRFKTRKYYMEWLLGGFCSKLVVLKMSTSCHHEFVIVILYDFTRCVAFARHGDPSWTPIFVEETPDSVPERHITDVVGMDNYAFILNGDGSIVYLNFKETPSLEHAKPMDYSPPAKPEIFKNLHIVWWKKYLVQSRGDLLMLLRYKEEMLNSDRSNYNYDIVYRTFRFEVYKLDNNDKSWEKTDDFGDVALFVGCNSSMSVSVVGTKYLQRNCVYFTDDEDEQWSRVKRFGGRDMGVFDVTKNKLRKFYKGGDRMGSLICPPIWFTPKF